MRFIKYSLIYVTAFGVTVVLGFEYYKLYRSKVTLTVPLKNSVTLNPSPTLAFSLENAPSGTIKGAITKMEGDVSWQSRVATEAAIITAPITIQQGENLKTGSKSGILLNFQDAVSVDISENTEIDVIQTLPTNIVYSQPSGSAKYFKLGTFPVSVRTKYLLAAIDGDVTISYDQAKPAITLKISNGSATLAYNDKKYISHEVVLSKGQTYTFNYDTRKGVVK